MAKKRKAKSQAIARRPSQAIERPTASTGELSVFERMARDPGLTVEKLATLIALKERMEDRAAARSFDTAYRLMLIEIPRITKRGAIKVKGEVQSRYSKYEDIRKVCDPIMRKHGFSFHTQTEWPATGVLEVVGILEHNDGGRRESRFRTTADPSGNKNAIQGLGSGVSYGKRYAIKDLLSIVEESEDDDGQAHDKTSSRQRDKAPATIDVPPTGHDRESGEPITDDQIRRLTRIMQQSRRSAEEVKRWVDQRYGWQSMRQITRALYDEVCRAIEAPGDLPL